MSDDSSNRTDVSTIHLDNISLQNRENVDDDNNSKFLGFDLSTQQVSAGPAGLASRRKPPD